MQVGNEELFFVKPDDELRSSTEYTSFQKKMDKFKQNSAIKPSRPSQRVASPDHARTPTNWTDTP
jgi:hypothetical protein